MNNNMKRGDLVESVSRFYDYFDNVINRGDIGICLDEIETNVFNVYFFVSTAICDFHVDNLKKIK